MRQPQPLYNRNRTTKIRITPIYHREYFPLFRTFSKFRRLGLGESRETLLFIQSLGKELIYDRIISESLNLNEVVDKNVTHIRETSDTLTFNQTIQGLLPIVHLANFNTAQSKTAGTFLAIVGSQSVAIGNSILVSYAGDDVGSNFSVSDNLGNTYSLVKETIKAGQVKSQLWRSSVTIAGVLLTVTISWTTNVTSKAGVVSVFGNVGNNTLTGGVTATSATCNSILNQSVSNGDLLVGTHGYEGPNSDNITAVSPATETGQNGTTGGGAGTNITCHQAYRLFETSGTESLSSSNATSTSRNNSGAGARYSPKIF